MSICQSYCTRLIYFIFFCDVLHKYCICLIAKKKNKKKATTLSLGEFLGDEAAQIVTTTKSWADEMDQVADS